MEESKLLDELIELGDRLSYIYYYSWALPFIDSKKEKDILKRMKEIVSELTKRKMGEVI